VLPHVICNVCHRTVCLITIVTSTRHHVRKVPLVDLNVNPERTAKGGDLHVVAVRSSSCHHVEVTFKDLVDVGLGGSGNVGWAVEGSGIFAFGVASCAAAGVDIDELFVIGGMITHVTDHLGTDGSVGGLVAVYLVGKGVEQAVAYAGRKLLACEHQGRLNRQDIDEKATRVKKNVLLKSNKRKVGIAYHRHGCLKRRGLTQTGQGIHSRPWFHTRWWEPPVWNCGAALSNDLLAVIGDAPRTATARKRRLDEGHEVIVKTKESAVKGKMVTNSELDASRGRFAKLDN
jgi:hypothetical protein